VETAPAEEAEHQRMIQMREVAVHLEPEQGKMELAVQMRMCRRMARTIRSKTKMMMQTLLRHQRFRSQEARKAGTGTKEEGQNPEARSLEGAS
jgi:hypothetical protein